MITAPHRAVRVLLTAAIGAIGAGVPGGATPEPSGGAAELTH